MNKAEGIPQDEIKAIFRSYHEQLTRQIRYERFMVGETLNEWVMYLGPDVLGLTHPRVTAEITQHLVDFHESHGLPLNKEEKILLLTTPWIHDLGELQVSGRGVGDVTFEQKTDSHEKVERSIFDEILAMIPPGPEKELMHRAYTEVAMDRTTKLGRLFNAAERIGYLQTAILAWEGLDDKRIANWAGLVGNVLSNQIAMLLTYQEDFPYVETVLTEEATKISRMFEEVSAASVPLDNQGGPSYDITRFTTAMDLWKKHAMVVTNY